MVSIWCCIPSLNDILHAFIPTSSSLMTILYVIVAVAFLFALLIGTANGENFKLPYAFVFTAYIAVLYGVTLALDRSSMAPQYLFCYFLIPVLIITFPLFNDSIDVSKVVLFISIIPSFGILFLNKIFEPSIYSTISMGTSYNFLTPSLACLAFLFLYYRRIRRIWKVLYIPIIAINCIFMFNLIKYGSRGPIVCIFFFLLFVFLFKHDDKVKKIRFSGLLGFAIILVLVLFLINFWSILNWLSDYFNSNFINKMLKLYQEGNVLNNRNLEFEASATYISNNPLFGYGLSSFSYYTGYVYPHNLFLQLLFDGGLILLFLVIIPIILFIVKLFKRCSYDDYAFFAYFFSVAVIKSFVSGNIWENDKLWLFFAYCIVSISSMKAHRLDNNRVSSFSNGDMVFYTNR